VVADFLIETVQGAMMMGKIERSSRPVETTVVAAPRHVRRSLGPPTEKRDETLDNRLPQRRNSEIISSYTCRAAPGPEAMPSHGDRATLHSGTLRG